MMHATKTCTERTDMADANAKPPCDIILRGGITSGVIYPGTIHGLAKTYRFVNVGGASAGAIAAGVTAAAEYGRQTGSRPDAFDELAKLATKVSGGPGSETSMRRLFSPDGRFRRLNGLLWAWLGLGATARRVLRYLFLAVLAAALLAPLLALFGVGGTWLMVTVVAFYGVLLVGFVAYRRLSRVLSELPEAGFGLCPGANPDVEATMAAHKTDGWLADWLHATIQDMAGRVVGQVPDGEPGTTVPLTAQPLTVGDLWSVQGAADGPDPTRRLNLSLTTTNLSHQLPHNFPFLERPEGALYFCPRELRRVVPEDVVRWMVVKSPERRADGYYRLPPPADLPVLLGVRLSLSFPLLIAAVPLHAPDLGRPGEPRPAPVALQRCWFSDGGITSNFPISAFDSPLPSRPTFCINLAEATDEETAKVAELDAAARDDILVWMPPVDDRPHAPRLRSRFEGSILGFLGAVSTTARNAHENELVLMPGYRDRIVEIATRKDEGGLNLAMPPATIEALSRRGARAATELTERFNTVNGGGWPVQRWVRFRSTMDAMERMLQAFQTAWHRPTQGARNFDDVRRQWSAEAEPACYPWADEATAAAADRAVGQVLVLADSLAAERQTLGDRVFDRPGDVAGAAPRPPLDLKMRPTGREVDAPTGAPPQGVATADAGTVKAVG
ncbi:MAG: hypothetical protein EA356_05175 [Geminicoccaceae bacterium]|nr:MAG: hypothetical protein EA356_05175 [Geminicoccaceae bacterium]